MFFYAVARGRTPGVFNTWDECKAQISGYKLARFKKFNSRRDAEEFVRLNTQEERAGNVVYTDGACLSNGTEYARAGWGVWWPGGNRELYGRVDGNQTNQRAEATAVLEALLLIRTQEGEWTIMTDSSYVIDMTKQQPPQDAPNADLLAYIFRLKGKTRICYVQGHSGDAGNERADELARRGASGGTYYD